MKVRGKKIVFLGDSITAGQGLSDCNNRYDAIIKRELEAAEVFNYGVGGTRLAYQQKISNSPMYDLHFCGRAWSMEKDADIVVVFGGTNDFSTGDAPFGNMKDRTPATFCGAVEYLMTYLQAKYKDSQIIFVTPARRSGDENSAGNVARRGAEYVLLDFVNVIKQKGDEHNIPILDLYENLGINPNHAEDREKYTIDGLHFNDEGHIKIAEKMMEFMKKL